MNRIYKAKKGTEERRNVHYAMREQIAKFRAGHQKGSDSDIKKRIDLFKDILERLEIENEGNEFDPRDIIITNDKLRNIGAGIINLDTAISCLNRMNGRCPICKNCFSLNHERRLDHVLIHHMKQAIYFYEKESKEIAKDIFRSYYPYIRWNESGDIENISQVEKMNEIMDIANSYEKIGFQTYSKSFEIAKNLNEHCSLVDSLTDRNQKSYRFFQKPLYDKKNNRFKRQELHYYLGMDICLGKCEECRACFERDVSTHKWGCQH